MSSRLPETDLANWSFLPAVDKRRALTAFEGPKIIKGSYEPFRRLLPDAINQQFPLFGGRLQQSNWDAIEQRLWQECKGSQVLLDMNRAILAATHQYADNNKIAADGIDIVPLRFPGNLAYSFGMNLLVRYRDHASVIFLDMRRTHGLNPNGRSFIFSVMHHRFREAYPDLSTVNIEIWKYRNNEERTLVSLSASDNLHSYEQMVEDIVETHQIWESVKRGGDEVRRTASGGSGPLFDRYK